ncbi:MAG: hypothetical protein AAFR75_00355 [Pseudomonadota bacterium]
MKSDWKFTEMTVIPKVAVNAVRTEIKVEKIPAIQSLAGSAGTGNTPEGGTFCPTETLFVLENENGNYEVLNDLRRIQPELTRVAAETVEVILIDRKSFEMSKEDEALFREFLLRVVPRRSVGDNSGIAQIAHQGYLDRFHPFYGTEKSVAGKFTSVSAMFVDGQLKRSTFHRQCGERDKPFKKTIRNVTQQARRRKQKETESRDKKEEKRREKEAAIDDAQNTEREKKQRVLFDED